MDKQIAENDFVTGFTLGKTYEGVDIRGLKISKKIGNMGVFIEGGIHARFVRATNSKNSKILSFFNFFREWISPAVATYTINQLITSKGILQNFF